MAVIDTGISIAHSGLRARIAAIHNFVDGGESSFARDLHRTAVAAVIAACRDARSSTLSRRGWQRGAQAKATADTGFGQMSCIAVRRAPR